jgi:hypothetical protein
MKSRRKRFPQHVIIINFIHSLTEDGRSEPTSRVGSPSDHVLVDLFRVEYQQRRQ